MSNRLVTYNELRYSAIMRLFIALIALLPALAAADTELYTWIDKDGSVNFSDQPHPGAKKITVKDVSTISGPEPRQALRPEESPTAPFTRYEKITVTSPPNNGVVRDNTGAVNVSVGLQPPLRTDLGHTVRVSLAGKQQGGAATQFSFTDVDRGTHVVHATVLDKEGKPLMSTSSTFTLHRISRLLLPNTRNNTSGTNGAPSPQGSNSPSGNSAPSGSSSP